ncbi:MAG TPA: hypothetical protein VE954_42115 [Oligoflexus sp.]|uniref:hypothetical protein n=1 Tax=Oligoflexus sp. TaxID=1971216 RepID=UPI002D6BA58E|nr:hypothetical protein [Oligoflexus sp.]HYX39736.1 hypothetical protein [Oligoflexus sp.]
MNITLSEVKNIFEKLLNGTIRREEADRWAHNIIMESERGHLTFSPTADQEKIWAGIMYLYGVDTRDSPEEYLHTTEDIRAAMLEKLGL